jgi:hypothetical protein
MVNPARIKNPGYAVPDIVKRLEIPRENACRIFMRDFLRPGNIPAAICAGVFKKNLE